MNELWVARDGNGDVYIFSERPSLDEFNIWFTVDADVADILPVDMFPDLKPGECMRLVLAEVQ